MINKLQDIDLLIEDSKSYQSTDKFLKKLVSLLLSYLGIDEEINIKAIFIREIEYEKKRFIALCLLRVYSINPTLLINMSIKHNVHRLFILIRK
ncbi:MAG: hypothetical protein HQ521_17540 [Bacteroidetes bacterium]|nr:hypothetical protein [Bacteroidota bacterium]